MIKYKKNEVYLLIEAGFTPDQAIDALETLPERTRELINKFKVDNQQYNELYKPY